jgi:sugar-specific transcriptional regulator TrmB
MIDKWVDVLKLFDLGEYESKTYAALVMNGPSTAKEIQKAAGIPYSREYDILDGLKKRGFVKMQPGRPKVYSAENPRKILKRECEIRVNVVDSLLEEIGPAFDRTYEKKSGEEFFWTLEGKENIKDKLIEMIEGSKKEIDIVGTSTLSSDGIAEVLKASIKRGITVKCWGEFNKKTKSLLEGRGVKVRLCKCDHSRYVLVDGKEALVSQEDPTNANFALYVTSPGCTKLYQSYFNHIWEESA